MKNLFILSLMLLAFKLTNAQNELNLTGKTFQKVDKTPSSTSEVYFASKTEVVYIITSVISGKTYIDKCPGKATINGNKVSINCLCDDKEIYPDPILDSFNYDSQSKRLTSASYRSIDGVWVVWNLK